MCKNIDTNALIEDVKTTLKYLDGGKILGVGGKVLELDFKGMINKVKNIGAEDIVFGIESKLRLVKDMLGWPFQLAQSLF